MVQIWLEGNNLEGKIKTKQLQDVFVIIVVLGYRRSFNEDIEREKKALKKRQKTSYIPEVQYSSKGKDRELTIVW